MPTYSGGKDESPDRDQPFTGDGGTQTNDNRLPAKGEVTVRDGDGAAKLRSTNALFSKKNKKK